MKTEIFGYVIVGVMTLAIVAVISFMFYDMVILQPACVKEHCQQFMQEKDYTQYANCRRYQCGVRDE